MHVTRRCPEGVLSSWRPVWSIGPHYEDHITNHDASTGCRENADALPCATSYSDHIAVCLEDRVKFILDEFGTSPYLLVDYYADPCCEKFWMSKVFLADGGCHAEGALSEVIEPYVAVVIEGQGSTVLADDFHAISICRVRALQHGSILATALLLVDERITLRALRLRSLPPTGESPACEQNASVRTEKLDASTWHSHLMLKTWNYSHGLGARFRGAL
ncbi:unnamed protein product [Phytophthora fragariaefolia]|uniref:Unnamed protein product n=1 Tax=Phytophthora fragariaefolia TaxID=1490495 RepID=A0A9W7D149_9STRA|nr:unnamed protein product [Phytophthora fragariaefolia]